MALEETFDVVRRRDRARGHRDHRAGLRPDLRQALMLLGIGPDGPVSGRRVAVTGLGVVSCCGIGTEALWTGLNGPPPMGERRVPDFDPEQWFVHQGGPAAWTGSPSSPWPWPTWPWPTPARSDADPGRSGVVMGTGVGGLDTLEKQILRVRREGPPSGLPLPGPDDDVQRRCRRHVHPARVARSFARRSPPRARPGPTASAHAARLVASGRCDVAIGGAAEAGMTGVGIAAFANMTALSTSGNSRPFDAAAGRVRDHRGRRRPGPRGVGPGRGPRGPDLRRAGRLGQHGRRPPHHRSHPGGFGCRGLHDPGHGGRRR